MELSGAVITDLKEYLLSHEDDIYYGINDFGRLSYVFHVLIERQPMEMRPAAADSDKEKK